MHVTHIIVKNSQKHAKFWANKEVLNNITTRRNSIISRQVLNLKYIPVYLRPGLSS